MAGSEADSPGADMEVTGVSGPYRQMNLQEGNRPAPQSGAHQSIETRLI
jgi:hypothetical protein